MKTCHKCMQELDDVARFCSFCGTELANPVFSESWIAWTQEQIKEARHNRAGWLVGEWLGSLLVAINIIYLTVKVREHSNAVGWSIVALIFSCLVVLGAIIGYNRNNKKIKNLMEQLKVGELK